MDACTLIVASTMMAAQFCEIPIECTDPGHGPDPKCSTEQRAVCVEATGPIYECIAADGTKYYTPELK